MQFVSPKIYDSHTVNVDAQPGVPSGDKLVGVFHVTAPNLPISQFSATIDWGDGTTGTPATLARAGPDSFVVRGAHEYGKAGHYIFRVTINGPGGPIVIAGAIGLLAIGPLKAA